ncbi:LytTR family DNA-binding domain-containing protein [Anaerocolumna sp. MB42-C2]|uniref:LytTR family DNA-binding domain-containing protein n=1 Tax=Anaerocolumna sp. MB42-C2 TaxID=3070997 RepID=UPI0027E1132E|nr:LytTR family DNA-binding domain-containing protein [Anaerocolumna sp. MB42-C2]WMJ89123.1 LytTR family DNA-binding domain-containing protein [Anaerocolumna sp. MB42-C2]
MRVEITNIPTHQQERILIECYKVTEEVAEMIQFIKSRQESIEGYDESGIHVISLSDIYYVESVDNRVYLYLKDCVYEIKMYLYKFEELYGDKEFFRCSKNTIINLMKIHVLKPALNSRFSAVLTNGESVIISRKYVSELKKKLRGGTRNE